MDDIALTSSFEEYEKQLFKDILKKLSKCGFSNKRCSKAAASTGIVDERVAGEWLSAHVSDPDLDKEHSRDYYVFLCPNEELSEALMNYWEGCKKEGLWGQAQEYSPHITIIPRFQIHDDKVVNMQIALHNRICKLSLGAHLTTASLDVLSTSDPLDLKRNFLGYQARGEAKSVLETFSSTLLADLDGIGIVMEDSIRSSSKGIYHLSLSYGFSSCHLASLTSLMDKHVTPFIKNDPLHRWNLCLYSCDSRCRSMDELYRMKTAVKSWQLGGPVTLAYNVGDLVGLLNGPSDGVHGTGPGLNCSSGLSGIFALQHADRVPLYHAWTLHRQLSLGGAPVPRTSAGLVEPRRLSTSGSRQEKSSCNRRLFVMRHGERVDFCFKNWIPKCFDSKGMFRRSNLNMPVFLPRRKPEQYSHDSPLTVIGAHVAFETGVALRSAGVVFTRCYSSSALRCVQTATHCLRGMGQEDLGICVEPLLFEWMGWYKTQGPVFMSVEQLKLEGLTVNTDYVPLSRATDLRNTETPSQYYERKGRLVRRLVDVNKRKGSTILIVGHAASLDACTRPLVSKVSWPLQVPEQDFHSRSSIVPFCGLVVAEEHTLRWQLVEPPTPTFSYCKNADFNWELLKVAH